MTQAAVSPLLTSFNGVLIDTRKKIRQDELADMIDFIEITKRCDYKIKTSLENRATFIRKTPSQVFENVEQFKLNLNIFQEHVQTLQTHYKRNNGDLISYAEKFPLLRVSSIMKILWRALIQDRYSETGAIVTVKKQNFLVNKSSVQGFPVVSIVYIDQESILGEGTLTQIWCVFDVMQNCFAALKIPRKYLDLQSRFQAIEFLKNECRVLQDLHSPSSVTPNNIIDPPYQVYDMSDSHESYGLLYKKYPCDLLDMIQDSHLTWTRSMHIQATRELFTALHFLHRMGYWHGDLKPENVLVTYFNDILKKKLRLKYLIADFGDVHNLSEYESNLDLSFTHSKSHNFFQEYCVLQANLYKHNWRNFRIRAAKQDIFCLGVTLYELFTGQMPYSYIKKDNDPENEYFDHESTLNEEALRQIDLPVEIKDLIIKCLNKNPNERPSIKEAIAILDTIQV